MGTLVAARKIWTGEALTEAAAEGSGRALRSPAVRWVGVGAGKKTPPTGPSAGLPSQRDLDVCHLNTCPPGGRSETAKDPLPTRPLGPLNRSLHGDLRWVSPGCSPLHAVLRSDTLVYLLDTELREFAQLNVLEPCLPGVDLESWGARCEVQSRVLGKLWESSFLLTVGLGTGMALVARWCPSFCQFCFQENSSILPHVMHRSHSTGS